jgi:hypothetical protein
LWSGEEKPIELDVRTFLSPLRGWAVLDCLPSAYALG